LLDPDARPVLQLAQLTECCSELSLLRWWQVGQILSSYIERKDWPDELVAETDPRSDKGCFCIRLGHLADLFVALGNVVLVYTNRIDPEPFGKTFAHGPKSVVQIRPSIEATSLQADGLPRSLLAPYIGQGGVSWLCPAIENLDLEIDLASLRAGNITQQSYVPRSYGGVLVSSVVDLRRTLRL
jgi:hypothetical protein